MNREISFILNDGDVRNSLPYAAPLTAEKVLDWLEEK